MTTLYHFSSDCHLQLRSYQNGFIVLFPHYLSGKPETYRYFVWLGTLGIGWTIFWVAFGDFIVVLAWKFNHVIPSIAKVSQWQPTVLNKSCMLAFILRAQLTNRQIKSYHTKGDFEKLHPVHKGTALLKQNIITGIKCIGWVCSLTSTTTETRQLW